MKSIYKIKRTVLIILFAFAYLISNVIAQNDTMYIMKAGIIVGQYDVNAEIDSIIFYNPNISTSNTVTDYDGNVYKTGTIGSQVWMAENLRTTHYANGTAIPLVNTHQGWETMPVTSKAYCWYNDDITNKKSYGALYTWAAAMNDAASSTANPSGIQGVCPTGWHLPSADEWTQLANHLNGDNVAGGKLKEVGIMHWISPNAGATNETGFTALPGGNRNKVGGFLNIGKYGFWWTASENQSDYAWYRHMSFDEIKLGVGGDSMQNGFSVRCVKD